MIYTQPEGADEMESILKYLDMLIDKRQEKKVRHKMSDIVAIAFFATLANANEWTAIESFGKEGEEYLRKRLKLANGMVKSYHWHLDVTFREDDNHML